MLTSMSSVRELARDIDSPRPDVGLRAVAALRRLLEDLESAHVHRAREAGWTWEAIAQVLGVTRQSVHKKHSRTHRR
jgi:hypothetical protein